MALPTNIDSTYEDDVQDPSVQEHQEHHDVLHAAYNQRGRELDYAESTTSIIAERTGSNGVVDAPGLTVSYEFDGNTPVLLEAWGGISTANTNAKPSLSIRENDTALVIAWGLTISGGHFPSLQIAAPCCRFTPSAGIHTYKVSLHYSGTTNAANGVQLQAGETFPAFIRLSTVDEA